MPICSVSLFPPQTPKNFKSAFKIKHVSFQLCSFKKFFWLFSSFAFPCEFGDQFISFHKKNPEIFTGILLKLQVTDCNSTVILTICLPIHRYRISLHLFRFPVSLTRALQFSIYGSFNFIAKLLIFHSFRCHCR